VRASTVFLVLGIGALAGGGVGTAAHRLLPASPIVLGLYIGERRLPDRGPSAAEWLHARHEAALSRRVRFYHDDGTFEATLGDAGVEIDVAATLERAAQIGHKGPWQRRIREAHRARQGKIDVPLVWSIDEDRAKALFATYAPALARAPLSARLDLDKHAKIPDAPGRELSVEASLAVLRAAAHDDDEALPLVTRAVAAKVTLDDLSRVDITKVVAASETTFVTFGSGAGRAVNIRNAASRIDGTVLAPGAFFSFNDAVGPRTRERGFALAPEIQGDEMRDGYGGGTCQVSSTLHIAALFGALEIVERTAHSRASSYTLLGLDATVSYPLTDFKFRNALPFSVMIHAYLPKPTAIRVEILGGDPVARVDYRFGVNTTEDFVRRITVRPELPSGKRIRRQKGSRGYDVTSVVKIAYPDGREQERVYFSGYQPAPEVFWVASDFDMEALPPLPDHAKGIEGEQPGAAGAAEEHRGGA
jgi:vancomycin resistance protein YoaR